MTSLPIKRIILYKHGVGYFERRTQFSGEMLTLSFPLGAMDDVLKSLIVLDLGAGQVRSIGFETPENRAALLAKGSIHLSDNLSLLDLLRDLRGRRVRCQTNEPAQPKPNRTGFGLAGQPTPEPAADAEFTLIEGVMVGVDYEQEEPLLRAILSIYQPDTRTVCSVPLVRLRHIELVDDPAAQDLTYFLRAAQSEEDRRAATIYLTPGDHDVLIGYIAPAPAWRVSYRVLYEEATTQSETADAKLPELLLQGWGLFDNQLEEDLDQVQLSLVAGMPISFRYRLYEPKTPQRPLIEDEERTVTAPVAFASAPARQMMRTARSENFTQAEAPEMTPYSLEALGLSPDEVASLGKAASIDSMSTAVQVTAEGDQRGALFAYHVTQPVSVSRGQSAMVPIMSTRLPARRELIYNRTKQPNHPIATLRFTNETGLTLERGPVTVLEDGDYAGEAVVPFTTVGAAVIVGYAVELGITVSHRYAFNKLLVGIHVRDDYLQLQSYNVSHTTYTLVSTLDTPSAVVIEHALIRDATLVDTPEPNERLVEVARWKVACPAQSITTFVISEQLQVWNQQAIRSLNGQLLADYLAKKLLNEQTMRRLKELLTLYAQIDESGKTFQQIERTQQVIAKKQTQIQGNLTPLGRDGDEGVLRARYVAELNALEDQIQQLTRKEQLERQRVAEIEQMIREKLEALRSAERRT